MLDTAPIYIIVPPILFPYKTNINLVLEETFNIR